MKKTFLITVLLVAIFSSCNKEKSTTTTIDATLSASKINAIKLGEPLQVTYKSNSLDSLINWQVSPATGATIKSSGLTVVIAFTKKGDYVITGTTSHASATLTVNVSDSIYAGSGTPTGGNGSGGTPTTYTTVGLTGDQLKITPSVGDSIYKLFLSGVTVNKYNCLNNSLLFSKSQSGNAFAFDYTGVAIPDGNACTAGKIEATSFVMMAGSTDGTYTLSIKFNGVSYTGSYVKSGNTYTFNWPYTSGVIISPLTVTK